MRYHDFVVVENDLAHKSMDKSLSRIDVGQIAYRERTQEVFYIVNGQISIVFIASLS